MQKPFRKSLTANSKFAVPRKAFALQGGKNASPKLLFGTAGIPHSSKSKSSAGGIERVKELGLDAMELEFVYGVKMAPESALLVKKAQEKTGVQLTVHAPFYVNLNSYDKQKLGNSKYHILQSCRIASLCNADSITFHPGFYQSSTPKETFNAVEKAVQEMLAVLDNEKLEITLAPETTGKPSQFGSLEELLELHSRNPRVKLTVDFAHVHARGNGCLKKQEDFDSVLERIEKSDKGLLKGLHVHASGINYSVKGERNHLFLQDKANDFQYKLMLNSLKSFGVSGIVISESPNPEVDALLLKNEFEKL